MDGLLGDEIVDLPALDAELADEDAPLDDPEALDLELPAAGTPSLGDEIASDVPLDLSFIKGGDDPSSALGDDKTGPTEEPDAVDFEVDGAAQSFLEPDGEQQGLDDVDNHGLAAIPSAGDPTDADGLDDPLAVDLQLLPDVKPSADEEDQATEVGIEVDTES